MGYEPTWQLDVEAEQYRDLAEALNAIGRRDEYVHREKFDSMEPSDQLIHRGTVGSWHDGPLVKMVPTRGGEEATPGVDRSPLQAALSAGYVGHGFFVNSDDTWSWYLVSVDDLDDLVEKAERYMEARTKFTIVSAGGGVIKVDGEPISFNDQQEAKEMAAAVGGAFRAVPIHEVRD